MILFCLGLEGMSFFTSEAPSIEFLAEQNENLHSHSDVDLFDDDHISTQLECEYYLEYSFSLPSIKFQAHFPHFFDPAWRPPQFA